METPEDRGEQSAFHEGEIAFQNEAGAAERLARHGTRLIRSHMTQQHRDFFTLLPFVVVGSAGADGQPAASLLAGSPGFVSSPEPATLRIQALPWAGDPLEDLLVPGAPLALLGIEAHTKRRNRANGRIGVRDDTGFSLAVTQSFGNCPRYIVPRRAVFANTSGVPSVQVTDGLDAAARRLIASADTFYIATAHPDASKSDDRSRAADVSHRGGPPGFAHFLDEQTFVIPDYRGNDFFATLGNLRLLPAAGLLFVDPERRDVLALEARTQVVTGSHPLASANDSGRIVRFAIQRSRLFRNVLALRFERPGQPH